MARPPVVEGSYACPWILSGALSCVVFPLRKKLSFSFFALWDWSDFVHSVRFHDAGSVVARGALDTPGSSRCPCRTWSCQSLATTPCLVQARVLTAPHPPPPPRPREARSLSRSHTAGEVVTVSVVL